MKYETYRRMASGGFSNSGHERAESKDNDTTGMLSRAAPTVQYEAYRPPKYQQQSPDFIEAASPAALTNAYDLRHSTIQTSPPASPGFRASLFGNRYSNNVPYHENVAWANSTQFQPSTIEEPKIEYQAQIASALQEGSPQKQYFRNARHFRQPWSTGGWKRFPWRGLGALSLVVILTAGSAVVLFSADGRTPQDWKIGSDSVQPQVYISVFEMIMNLLTVAALSEGVVITFWRRLLHRTTVADMHDLYDSSFLWSALRRVSRLQFNMVGTASILTAFSFARGPFFQRALLLLENNTYQTSTLFVILGTIASLTGVIATITLYYGYWQLGRGVSLNPLEIARAFGGPMFDGLDGNMGATDVEIEKGGVAVRYGVVERSGVEKLLRVEDTERVSVRTPWEGEVFG
ncbi:hypothetical protein EJ02DRAFT_381248 [Clathrospora elynae]|uniref:Uncharacterized protein n=1 Tax=Clathrospora elynae TaxID=706981 RepID=A0A6A5SHW7_9PLEO|nr:hypothetical protein EJ02DRAFT_381248 [Clathrospora elynae]